MTEHPVLGLPPVHLEGLGNVYLKPALAAWMEAHDLGEAWAEFIETQTVIVLPETGELGVYQWDVNRFLLRHGFGAVKP